MNEDKASRYHRLLRRVRCLDLLWSGTVLTGLLMTGGSAVLRDASTAVTAAIGIPGRLAPAMIVAFYVTGLAALHESVALILTYYRDHLIESRYALSTQTTGRWFRAYSRSALIGFGFAQLIAGILYFSMRTWPTWWWMTAGLMLSMAMLVLEKAAPLVLLPFFYEFTPIERAELRERVARLARAAGTHVLGVYRWTLSDSTRTANAALVGLGRSRRILLSDTLLTNYSDDEVEVVLAHELGHHVHGDIWRGVVLNAVLIFATLFLAQRETRWARTLAGVTDPADVAGLPIVLLVFGALSLLVMPFVNAWSRAHERRADRFALRLTRNPKAFASAMRRLGRQNLAEEHPSRVARSFFYSHPPFADRVEMARRWIVEEELGEARRG